MFVRTLASLDETQLARPCQYVYPAVATRTLLWMGQQMVHEVEHHLGDIRSGVPTG